MTSLIIDASNLRTGGAVQVASGFITDLVRDYQVQALSSKWDTVKILVSSAVKSNLDLEPGDESNILVVDSTWKSLLRPKRRDRVDVLFTVFGPSYIRIPADVRIVGFADVTSIYGYPSELAQPNIISRIIARIRSKVKLNLFRRYSQLVVETSAIKDKLSSFGFDSSRITVVSNSPHPVFTRNSDGKVPQFPAREEGMINLCYITRDYPHKNLSFLGEVGRFAESIGLRFRFFVTLTPQEWEKQSTDFKLYCHNLGPLTIERVPSVYKRSDCVFFPSLLEASSATPLEAMVVGLPLAASDRDFVRTVVGDYAKYFDPSDPKSAALAIVDAISEPPQPRDTFTSRDRSLAYMELIDLYYPLSPWRDHDN